MSVASIPESKQTFSTTSAIKNPLRVRVITLRSHRGSRNAPLLGCDEPDTGGPAKGDHGDSDALDTVEQGRNRSVRLRHHRPKGGLYAHRKRAASE